MWTNVLSTLNVLGLVLGLSLLSGLFCYRQTVSRNPGVGGVRTTK